MLKALKDQRGMALISVLMLVLVLSALSAALLQMVTGDAFMAANEMRMFKALYAAEGGIRKFIVELNNNPHVEDWPVDIWNGFKNYAVGDAEIKSISYEESDDILVIRVVGACGKAKKTLVAHILKPGDSEGTNALLLRWEEANPIY